MWVFLIPALAVFICQGCVASGARPLLTHLLSLLSFPFWVGCLVLTIWVHVGYAECGADLALPIIFTVMVFVCWALSYWWGKHTLSEYRAALKAIEGDLPDRVKDGSLLLLRVDWLLEQDENFRLKRRQKTPKEAFWSPDDAVELLKQGKVAALSYRWLGNWKPQHEDLDVNDGDGFSLSWVLAYYDVGLRRLERPAIFIDFACLPQGDPNETDSDGKQTFPLNEEEDKVFKAGFNVMSNMYASPRVLVLRLRILPTELLDPDMKPPVKPYAGEKQRSGWCTSETALSLLFTEGGGHMFELGPNGGPVRPGSVQERPTYEQMEKIFEHESTLFKDKEERKKVSKGYLDLKRKVDTLQAERMNFLAQWANKILAGTTQHLDITVQRQASGGLGFTIDETGTVVDVKFGKLKVGDEIVAVNKEWLNAKEPSDELREFMSVAKAADGSATSEPKKYQLGVTRSSPFTCGRVVFLLLGLLALLAMSGCLVASSQPESSLLWFTVGFSFSLLGIVVWFLICCASPILHTRAGRRSHTCHCSLIKPPVRLKAATKATLVVPVTQVVPFDEKVKPLKDLPACFKYDQKAELKAELRVGKANRKYSSKGLTDSGGAKVIPEGQEKETRSWLQWAQRNDCCFAEDRSYVVRCAPYTGAKWLSVGILTIPLFGLHLLFWSLRMVCGGAFHKVLAREGGCAGGSRLPVGSSTSQTFFYYVVAGVPLLIDYSIAFGEMMGFGGLLAGVYGLTFGTSAAFACGVFCVSPVCAVEAVVQMMAISDGIYKSVFSKVPPGLEHPCKLFGFKFDFKHRCGRTGSAEKYVEPGYPPLKHVLNA